MGTRNAFLSSEEWVRDNAEYSEFSETDSEVVETDYVRSELFEDEWAI